MKGGFELVLRRAVSNASASSIALAMAIDSHRATEVMYEVALRAATLAAARDFHQEMRLRLAMHRDNDDGLRFQLHSTAGDATNANIWQNCKLRVQLNESLYVVDGVRPTDNWDDVKDRAHRRKIVSELQVVEDGSGRGTHAMVKKQCLSAGTPTWQLELPKSDLLPVLKDDEDDLEALEDDALMLDGQPRDLAAIVPAPPPNFDAVGPRLDPFDGNKV